MRVTRLQHGRLRSGFTLIELLVVVAIIAILMAILLPALGKARSQSQMVRCLSNVRQTAMGVVMYTLDNQSYFPSIQPDSQYPGSSYWYTLSRMYMTTSENPSLSGWDNYMKFVKKNQYCSEVALKVKSLATSQATIDDYATGRHFAMNAALGPHGGDRYYYNATNGRYWTSSTWRRSTTVGDPASTILISEGNFLTSSQNISPQLDWYYMSLAANRKGGIHQELFSNISFVDGHAESWRNVQRLTEGALPVNQQKIWTGKPD